MTFILLPFWTGCPLSVTESAVEGVRQPDAATNTVWHVDFHVQPPEKWLLTFPLVLTTLIGRSSMSPDCAVESPSKSAKAVPESALNSRQPRPSARKFWRNGCAFIIQLRVKLRGQPSRNLNSTSRLAYGSTVGGKGDKESFWTIPTTLRSPCLQCRFVRFGQSLARFCHRAMGFNLLWQKRLVCLGLRAYQENPSEFSLSMRSGSNWPRFLSIRSAATKFASLLSG